MLTSIATVSLSGGLREKLEAIQAAGFDGVEIFESDLLAYEGTAADVRRMAADLGLSIVAFQPFRDFEGMPEPQRTRVFDRAERKLDLMGELGTDLLLVCSNVSPVSRGGIDRAGEDLHALGDRAAPRGIRVGFEALAWGRHISDYRDAWEAVRRAGHDHVGIILDSFHILARDLDLAAISSIPREKIFLVQLADAPEMEMGVLSWSRHFRCFPGQGRFRLDRFMARLADTGYDGTLSLEIFNDQFRSGPPRQIAADGRRSLVFLGEQLARAGIESPLAADPPPPPALEGLEFVEFAVGEQAADELAAVFAGLGFRRIGRHRSKAVDLWRQGDINLVLNSEPDGFAQSHRLVHGPSVCAIAIRVADAERAVARADRYNCQIYRTPVGPGELEIPAVRGLEGGLIYLVDRYGERGSIWDVDFVMEPDAASAAPPARLDAIDHIAQVVPFGWLPSWVLFYRAVFGFEAAPELDIADPSGLIQSQAVESADRRIRIALNVSQSQRTAAGRFLSEYFGGGVQHLAFSTPDVLGAVDALQQAGVPFLPVPDNYYADVEARFGLDPALVDRLRACRVLYDQADGGEFFQAYTSTFANRFFFELVERHGYDQFGAANAAIRLAAQRSQITGGEAPGI
jgi:4-hydroxyphenylpyruvate dioxygenase